MSSVVQSLSAIPEFRRFFVQLDNHIDAATPAGAPSPGGLCRTSTVALVKDMEQGRSARRRVSDAAEGDAAAAERKKSLTFQLSHLLRVLWSGKILLATPHRLLAAVYEHGPRFSGFEQQDAQDFYYFLLERTHDELVRQLERRTWSLLLNRACIRSDSSSLSHSLPAGGEDGRGLAGAARPRESLQG